MNLRQLLLRILILIILESCAVFYIYTFWILGLKVHDLPLVFSIVGVFGCITMIGNMVAFFPWFTLCVLPWLFGDWILSGGGPFDD
jgi:hypothetical protein